MSRRHATTGEGAGLRTFFAVDFDDGTRARLAGLVERLRGARGGEAVRWLSPENLHVTLRFLGNVARDSLAGVLREVRAAVGGLAPFELELGAVEGFPSRRRPRVVAVAIPESPPLSQLAAAVEAAVVRAGLAAREGRFRPHLTLGRVREKQRAAVTGPVTAPCDPVHVNEIVLFHSEFRSGPGRRSTVYTPLERIALGGAEHPTNPTV